MRCRLDQLKEVGVTLSIDDFGTGYSSLAALSQLPVDQVKLDKTFVDGIVTTPRDQAIVRSVIELAQSLGLSTVAEGIESEDQAQLLQELHCDLGQGFLLARPMAAEPAGEFLFAHQPAAAGRPGLISRWRRPRATIDSRVARAQRRPAAPVRSGRAAVDHGRPVPITVRPPACPAPATAPPMQDGLAEQLAAVEEDAVLADRLEL